MIGLLVTYVACIAPRFFFMWVTLVCVQQTAVYWAARLIDWFFL